MISVDEIPFGRFQLSLTSDHWILAGFNRRITNVQPEHSFHQAAVQGPGAGRHGGQQQQQGHCRRDGVGACRSTQDQEREYPGAKPKL